jgi:hypothetical protein
MDSSNNYPARILTGLYLFFVAGQVAFIWWLPWFPTQDGPCHMYNLAILKDLRNGGQIWGQWFEQHLTLTPNMGFHIVTYPLLSFFSPESAEKIFISIALILFSSAIPFSLTLLGLRCFPWSFLVIPAFWSFSLAMGFYSFIVALPLLAVAMAVTISRRSAGLLTRFCILTALSALLFICHLIPFACLGLFVLISELADEKMSPGKRFTVAMFLLTPSAAALAWHLSVSSSSQHLSAPVFLMRAPYLLADLLTVSTIFFSPLQAVSGVALAFLFSALLRNYPASLRPTYCQKVYGIFALVIAILAVMAPPSPGGGNFFNQRLPTVVLLALIPLFASRHDHYQKQLRNSVIPVIVLFMIITSLVVTQMSSVVAEYMSAQNQPLKKGSVILSFREPDLPYSRVDVLAHAVSHYAAPASLINAGNYQTEFDYFPVHYHPEIKAQIPSANQVNHHRTSLDFEKFSSIGYLVVWDTVLPESALKRYSKLFQDKRVSVWSRSVP